MSLNPQVVERAQEATFIIENAKGGGTAFLVEPQIALTAAHVVESGDYVEVTSLSTGAGKIVAQVIWRDDTQDLAALRLSEPVDIEPLAIATDMMRGEPVVAIGAPGGEMVLTDGEILLVGPDLIRASTQVAPGNSGGPLINGDGDVVGLVTMLEQSTGYAVAEPATQLVASLSSVADVATLTPAASSIWTFPVVASTIAALTLVVILFVFGVWRINAHRNRKKRLIRISI